MAFLLLTDQLGQFFDGLLQGGPPLLAQPGSAAVAMEHDHPLPAGQPAGGDVRVLAGDHDLGGRPGDVS
jgi:hypothetical protein